MAGCGTGFSGFWLLAHSMTFSFAIVHLPTVVGSGSSINEDTASPSVTKVAVLCVNRIVSIQVALTRLQKITTTMMVKLN